MLRSLPAGASSRLLRVASRSRVLARALPGVHRRGVDHEARGQLAPGGERGAAERNGPVRVALLLDLRAAVAVDRSCHARAERELGVRGVHDRIDRHGRNVALRKQNSAHRPRIFAPTQWGGKQRATRSDTLSEMSLRARLWLGLAVALCACPPPPAQFRVVGLDEARSAIQREPLVVIEAALDPRTGEETPQAEVPAGAGVLVFGLDARAARRRAAAFARAGNQPVLLFIPRDADERGRFYALATQRQEDRRGKDS